MDGSDAGDKLLEGSGVRGIRGSEMSMSSIWTVTSITYSTMAMSCGCTRVHSGLTRGHHVYIFLWSVLVSIAPLHQICASCLGVHCNLSCGSWLQVCERRIQ
jgi:hypothetical protein